MSVVLATGEARDGFTARGGGRNLDCAWSFLRERA